MKDLELKPCTFCDGKALINVNGGTAVSRVIEKWNRRVKDDE